MLKCVKSTKSPRDFPFLNPAFAQKPLTLASLSSSSCTASLQRLPRSQHHSEELQVTTSGRLGTVKPVMSKPIGKW